MPENGELTFLADNKCGSWVVPFSYAFRLVKSLLCSVTHFQLSSVIQLLVSSLRTGHWGFCNLLTQQPSLPFKEIFRGKERLQCLAQRRVSVGWPYISFAQDSPGWCLLFWISLSICMKSYGGPSGRWHWLLVPQMHLTCLFIQSFAHSMMVSGCSKSYMVAQGRGCNT